MTTPTYLTYTLDYMAKECLNYLNFPYDAKSIASGQFMNTKYGEACNWVNTAMNKVAEYNQWPWLARAFATIWFKGNTGVQDLTLAAQTIAGSVTVGQKVYASSTNPAISITPVPNVVGWLRWISDCQSTVSVSPPSDMTNTQPWLAGYYIYQSAGNYFTCPVTAVTPHPTNAEPFTDSYQSDVPVDCRRLLTDPSYTNFGIIFESVTLQQIQEYMAMNPNSGYPFTVAMSFDADTNKDMLVIWPPADIDRGFKIAYARQTPLLVNPTDTPIMPAWIHPLILQGALAEAEGREEREWMGQASQKFAVDLEKAWLRANQSNQAISMKMHSHRTDLRRPTMEGLNNPTSSQTASFNL